MDWGWPGKCQTRNMCIYIYKISIYTHMWYMCVCVCKHLPKRRSNPWKADPWLVDLANVPWEDVVCTVWGCNTLSLSPWPSRKRGMAAPNLAHDPNKKSEWVGSLLSEKDKRIIADPWCDRWEWWELSQGFSCGGPLHRKEPMTPMCMSSAVMNILGRRDGGKNGDPVFDCLKGAKTPRFFLHPYGLPAFLRRRCFMKSIPWEIPSWKLWSQSLPWPKSARQLGWLKCSYIWNFEWRRLKWTVLPRYQILKTMPCQELFLLKIP